MAKPPALPRVVARDEKKTSGFGVAERMCDDQVAGGSVEMKRESLPGWDSMSCSVVSSVGGLRARKLMWETLGDASNVFIIWDP